MKNKISGLLDYIKSCDEQRLKEYWVQFNHWEFPEELLQYKPEGWDSLSYDLKSIIINPIHEYIHSKITIKELLRESNKDRLSGNEFDVWWENEGNKPLTQTAKEILKSFIKDSKSDLN